MATVPPFLALLLATAAALRHQKAAPEVVYGVLSNGQEVYRAKLLAQVETWASGLPAQGRFFSVAGSGATQAPDASLIVEERCRDDYSGVACKEERLLEEGYVRSASWLVVLGEDNYVNTLQMERELAQAAAGRGANEPIALGSLGCGMGTNGTFCEEVGQAGGFCGGAGYALNRAALALLLREGGFAARREYASFPLMMPGDMATSCALRRKGLELVGVGGPWLGARLLRPEEFRSALAGGATTLHYCTPAVMRWLKALEVAPPQEVVSREAEAFPGGCCCLFANEASCPPTGKRAKLEPDLVARLSQEYRRLRQQQLLKWGQR